MFSSRVTPSKRSRQSYASASADAFMRRGVNTSRKLIVGRKKKGTYGPTVAGLLDYVAPKYSICTKAYPICNKGFYVTHVGAGVRTQSTIFSQAVPSLHALYGSQSVVFFDHLTTNNAAYLGSTQTYSTTNGVSCCISDMLKKTEDVPSYIPALENPGILPVDNSYTREQKFAYLGGSVSYVITNTSDQPCIVTFTEFTPKQWLPPGKDVQTCINTDNNDNRGTSRNTSGVFIGTGTSLVESNNDVTDVMWAPNVGHRTFTKMYWNIGTTTSIKLEGGASTRYVERFPARYLNNMSWASAFVDDIGSTKPLYAPGFSKTLMMTIKGAVMAHSADLTKHNIVGAQVSIVATEQHSFRAWPFVLRPQKTLINLLDTTLVDSNALVVGDVLVSEEAASY